MTLRNLEVQGSALFDEFSLFRSLQDAKIDDQALLADLLSQCNNSQPRLLDLCGGTGRVTQLAISLGWSSVVVDCDTEALEIARVRCGPLTQIVNWDLSAPLTGIGVFDAVVCAHNSINEVGALEPIFLTVASALAPGGWFYCEVVTSPYLREYLVEPLLIATDAEGACVVNTAVLPIDETRHDLLLLGALYDQAGLLIRRVQHTVCRRTFPVNEIFAAAASTGLIWGDPFSGQNRFIFYRPLHSRADAARAEGNI